MKWLEIWMWLYNIPEGKYMADFYFPISDLTLYKFLK